MTVKCANNKSNGKLTTDVKNEMLKRPGENMCKFIYPLIRTIWEEEEIPEKWNVGQVTNMDFMFNEAISFKQVLRSDAWVMSKASKEDMFEGTRTACAAAPSRPSAFSPFSRTELKSAVTAYQANT